MLNSAICGARTRMHTNGHFSLLPGSLRAPKSSTCSRFRSLLTISLLLMLSMSLFFLCLLVAIAVILWSALYSDIFQPYFSWSISSADCVEVQHNGKLKKHNMIRRTLEAKYTTTSHTCTEPVQQITCRLNGASRVETCSSHPKPCWDLSHSLLNVHILGFWCLCVLNTCKVQE